MTPLGVAHATTPVATPYPMAHPVAGLITAGQMVEANGHLFVSSGISGSDVTVLSPSGTTLSVIGGEPGADGIVASPDGHSVYVALEKSSAISVIDTSTLAETARYTVDGCPQSVALASGRLFYTYGCTEETSSSGVSSIDPASGGTPVATSIVNQQEAGVVRGSGSALAVAGNSGSLSTYTADGTGALTALASTPLDQAPSDMAFTADGNHLLITVGVPNSAIRSYTTDTLSQDATTYQGVDDPRAVAADPTGQNVAVGFGSSATTVALYGQSSGTTKWQRYTTGTDPSQWRHEGGSSELFESQTMTFSPDGSMVYGLVNRANINGLFLFSSAVAPRAAPAISVKVPDVRPGKKQVATITVHGVGRTELGVSATSANASASLGTVTTNSSGVAHVAFRAPYSGTVSAGWVGSATRLSAKTTAKFSVGSKTSVHLAGSYRKWHGITYFKSYKKVNVLFHTTPPEGQRRVKFEGFIRRNNGWDHQHWRIGYEDAKGIRIIFKSAPKYAELKMRLKVPGDQYSRGSTATSKIFEIA